MPRPKHRDILNIRGSWSLVSGDDSGNGRQADLADIQDRKDFVTRLGDLSKQPPRPPLVPDGEPGSWVLSREYEFSMAELAGRLGVCISEIAKALRKMGGED